MASLYHYLFGYEEPVEPEQPVVIPEMYQYIDPTDKIRYRLLKNEINKAIINRVAENNLNSNITKHGRTHMRDRPSGQPQQKKFRFKGGKSQHKAK